MCSVWTKMPVIIRCKSQFYVHGSIHHKSTLIIFQMQQYAVYVLFCCIITLHVSGVVHTLHQEFFTVHVAMVYIIQVC
jgi:hypothetical protein